MVDSAHYLQIEHYAGLTEKVICQTRRRVLIGEKVPAKEKIVSIFEPHTDIIVKDRRDTIYGHKVCLTGGASNLILDCVVERGNPADCGFAIPMLDRQKQIYKRYPLKVCFDGGFASKDNLKLAKGLVRSKMCALPKNAALKKPRCAEASMCTIACAAFVPGSSPAYRGSSVVWDLPVAPGKAGRHLSLTSGPRLWRPTC
jgi:hypothetical protein